MGIIWWTSCYWALTDFQPNSASLYTPLSLPMRARCYAIGDIQ